MDIYDKISALERELSCATSLVFSKKSAVDVSKCESLLQDIKRALPASIQEASYIISQKDAIISSAVAQAELIEKEACAKVKEMLDESNIISKSKEIADKSLKDTEIKCSAMVENAQQKIDLMLKNIEEYLMDSLRIIRNNREDLAGEILKRKS
jgi:hypothetical protein